eukprot:gene21608-28608_t
MPPKLSRRRSSSNEGIPAPTKTWSRARQPLSFLAGSACMCIFLWVIYTWASQQPNLSPSGNLLVDWTLFYCCDSPTVVPSSLMIVIIIIFLLAFHLTNKLERAWVPPCTSKGTACSHDDFLEDKLLLKYQGDYTFLRQQSVKSPFVFIHIPKTGATSILENIKQSIEKTGSMGVDVTDTPNVEVVKRNATLFHNMVDEYIRRGGFSTETAIQRLLSRQHMHVGCFYTHLQVGPGSNARLALANLASHDGARIRFVIGHVPYGYCMFAEKGCTYVTLMREPISRLLSHYYYLQQMHPDMLKSVCKGGCSDFPSFIREMSKGGDTLGLDNIQTRMLGGESFRSTSTDLSMVCKSDQHGCDFALQGTEEHYQMAEFNLLHNFGVVGIASRLDLFTEAMKKVYDIDPKLITKEAGSEPNGLLNPSSLDYETMKITEEFCKWDIKLYNLARKIVELQHTELKSGKPLRKAPVPLVASQLMDAMDKEVREAVGLKP